MRLAEGFVYLAAVLDAFSRALGDHPEASLAIEALDMAVSARSEARHAHPPSDRGVQYASSAYAERLMQRKIIGSTSRSGSPYDNAKAESFMKTLKSEEVDGKTYAAL